MNNIVSFFLFFCLMIVGLAGCSPLPDYTVDWVNRFGDRFELVKLSDVKQLDGSFVFGTGEIRIDNEIIFAYKNKEGDIQIGTVSYDRIKIRYVDQNPCVLIEYREDFPVCTSCNDLQDVLKYRYFDYAIFCIPENSDEDFIKDWK